MGKMHYTTSTPNPKSNLNFLNQNPTNNSRFRIKDKGRDKDRRVLKNLKAHPREDELLPQDCNSLDCYALQGVGGLSLSVGDRGQGTHTSDDVRTEEIRARGESRDKWSAREVGAGVKIVRTAITGEAFEKRGQGVVALVEVSVDDGRT